MQRTGLLVIRMLLHEADIHTLQCHRLKLSVEQCKDTIMKIATEIVKTAKKTKPPFIYRLSYNMILRSIQNSRNNYKEDNE